MSGHNWSEGHDPQSRWATRVYWPIAYGEPPRLPDGSVDVRALCRRWDDAWNCGTGEATR